MPSTESTTIPSALPPSQARHFQIDHLKSDLKGRTLSSGVVTLSSQGAKFALNLASTVILARLLNPHDFGLLAMANSVVNLLRIFKDAGLSSATVQHKEINHAQVSNLFWLNVAVGAISAGIFAASAPLISWFYRQPDLIAVSLWLSLTFLFNGSTVQHLALLRRQMRFTSIAVVEVGSITLGSAAGVLMALAGCGYWSLVGMNLATEGSAVLLTWSMSRWRPQLPKSRAGTRPLVSFGMHMTAGSALNILSRSADSVLLGRFYGADVVGLYSRALALLTRPLDQLMRPVGEVFIATLSRLQTEPLRYRRFFMQAYESAALGGFVFAGFLVALARPITLVLLGSKWEAVVPIFSGFTLCALLLPVGSATGWLLISQGRGREFLINNIISSSVIVVSVLVGLPFGAVGVAFAFAAGLFVRLPVLYYLAGRQGPVSTRDLWLGLARHLPVWIAVLGAAWGAKLLALPTQPVLQLLCGVPAGLLAAGLVIAVLPAQRAIAVQSLNLIDDLRHRYLARR